MKVYTKRGDKGETSLFGGSRVAKSSPRIKAYGTVDELNSLIGLAASYSISERGSRYIPKIQEDLFILGTDLATPPDYKERIDRLSEDAVDFLEEAIDEMEEELEPLRRFILPGGSNQGATLHYARTVCRRAERETVDCADSEDISALTIKYLNRLSDFLFVLARFENKQAGVSETEWKPDRKSSGRRSSEQ